MGYVRNVIYKLTFEDEQYAGLEIRARSAPIKSLMELATLVDLEPEQLTANGMQAMRDLCAGFSKALVSWNVEESVDADGNPVDPDNPEAVTRPVPATEEGLLAQDFDFVIAIVLTWMDTVAGAAAPLAKRSADGPSSVQTDLIPMEPLSESQAS